MGFEVGFNKIEKYKNTTLNEALEALRRISFENNKWLNENNTSYEEYYKNDPLNSQPLLNPSQAIIDFYKNKTDDNIDYWCSIARAFDDIICNTLDKITNEYYLVNKNNINALKEIIRKKLAEVELIPAIVTHSIINNEDEMILKPIDGIQIELEDGQVRQIFFDDFEEDTIYVSKTSVDLETINVYNSLLNCILEIEKIDLDKYFVYYWRSW